MTFCYHPKIGDTFPQLFTGLVFVRELSQEMDFAESVAQLESDALRRLAEASEGEISAIRAWRSAFSTMGLKPTQYRCASEALLRRLRKDGVLPKLHPLVDLCNAASASHAIPVAAFDLDRVDGSLTVRPAAGHETYLTFGGVTEHPNVGEVVFADDAGTAHARRWTNRQSAASAVSRSTITTLIVIEGLHDEAETDVLSASNTLMNLLSETGAKVSCGSLRGGNGQFHFKGENL